MIPLVPVLSPRDRERLLRLPWPSPTCVTPVTTIDAETLTTPTGEFRLTTCRCGRLVFYYPVEVVLPPRRLMRNED